MENYTSLHLVKNTLYTGGHTCVIAENDIILMTSQKRGVAPLIDFIRKYMSYGEYTLADKVIGKAAALICVKANIKHVYTTIITAPAKKIFNNYGIIYEYDIEVPAIKNRAKTGLCPMETLSAGVETPDDMFDKVVVWLKSMNLS